MWFAGTFGGLGGAKGGAKDKFIRFYDVFDEVVERHRIGKVRFVLLHSGFRSFPCSRTAANASIYRSYRKKAWRTSDTSSRRKS